MMAWNIYGNFMIKQEFFKIDYNNVDINKPIPFVPDDKDFKKDWIPMPPDENDFKKDDDIVISINEERNNTKLEF